MICNWFQASKKGIIMIKKSLLILFVTCLMVAGCVKTTIDLNKLSSQSSLSPSIRIAAVKGNVTLGNLVEPTDTLVIDTDNSIKLVYKLDSVIDFTLNDFYTPFTTVVLDRTFFMLGSDIENMEETIVVYPGEGIKIKEMAVLSGAVQYTITSGCNFDTEVHLSFSSITSGTGSLTRVITVGAGSTVSGNIGLSGRLINFASDPLNPFNRIPVTYSIYALEDPGIISDNNIDISVSFSEPDFDYARGYFGLHESTVTDVENFDTGMEDIFSKLTGSIYLTNPSITVNYQNSFGMPLRVMADVSGENDQETIQLSLDPFDLDYPSSETERDISSTFVISRDNSNLPDIVSMLPDWIYFGGSATSNPEGETAEDNIVFPDSRLNADIEIEVPFEFRTSNLVLSDTTDNFLVDNDNGESMLDILTRLRMDFYIENGFPLGGDITMSLYNSVTGTIIEQLITSDVFKPADVDNNGKVIAPKVHKSFIELTPDFISSVEEADRIIFDFTLYTTDQGTRDVKIYSDYNILFKAALSFKANIQLN